MSGSDFERPGAAVRPEPVEWPYHAPTPEDEPGAPFDDMEPLEADVVVETEGGSQPRRVRPWVVALVAGTVGALVGGVVMTATIRPEPGAPSVTVTLDTFPREFMGSERNDIQLREAGFGPTVERLNDEFEEQLAAHRFAHGGRGATFGYGRLIDLTIVDGILAPGVPRDGAMDLGGRVRETRRMISLDTSTVSCTFEPQPVINTSLGMEEFGDLSGIGRTECVLVDPDRTLSLRVAHNPRVRGSTAPGAAAEFSDALRDLHEQLVS